MDADSVTTWIEQLKAGKNSAAQKFWERHLARSIDLAASRLRSGAKRISDEEDLVLSVFEEYRHDLLDYLFGRLGDPDSIEIVRCRLASMTAREIADHLKFSLRTVERGLNEIRQDWRRLIPPPST